VPENVKKTGTAVSYSIANSAHKKTKKKLLGKSGEAKAKKALKFSPPSENDDDATEMSTIPSTSPKFLARYWIYCGFWKVYCAHEKFS